MAKRKRVKLTNKHFQEITCVNVLCFAFENSYSAAAKTGDDKVYFIYDIRNNELIAHKNIYAANNTQLFSGAKEVSLPDAYYLEKDYMGELTVSTERTDSWMIYIHDNHNELADGNIKKRWYKEIVEAIDGIKLYWFFWDAINHAQ